MSRSTSAPVPSEARAETVLPGSGRLVSLDAFRGATIVGMILVNNPGTWAPSTRRCSMRNGTAGHPRT